MAEFGNFGRFRDGEGEFDNPFPEPDFGTRNAGRLVPMPATTAVTEKGGDVPTFPSFRTEPSPEFPSPFAHPAAVSPAERATDPRFRSGPVPQPQPVPDEFVHPTTTPPTAGPGVGTKTPGGKPGGGGAAKPVNAQDFNPTGNEALDRMRAAIREKFQLGASDLSDPRMQQRASQAFQEYITAAGGSPNLRAEIGDARFVNRLQEFLGKGDTLDQSGRIQVGNGVVINSLRSLSDFGRPSGGGTSTTAPPAGGARGTSAAGGAAGRGRGGGASSARFARSSQERDALFAIEKNLRESLEREFEAGSEALEEHFLSRGIRGGGAQAAALSDLRQGLSEDMSQRLRDVAVTIGVEASNRELQREALDIQRRGQQLDFMLGNRRIDVDKALGEGSLQLQALAQNTAFITAMKRLGLDAAGLVATIQLGALGQSGAAVDALLDLANQIREGYR